MRISKTRADSRIGQALPAALMAMGLIGLTAAAVPRIVEYMNKRNQTVKVLNVMASVEERLRIALSEASSYVGCPDNCALKQELLPANLRGGARARSVLGAQCTLANPGCGVKVESLGMAGNLVNAVIAYEGSDVVVNKTSFSVRIPGHTSAIEECPSNMPVFLGLDVEGMKRCAPLFPCGAGQFVKSYNPETLALTCQSIPDEVVGCGKGKYIGQLSFGPDLKPQVTCVDRRTE
jgi:hypothetical protein